MTETCGGGQRARNSMKWHHIILVGSLMITLWTSNASASNSDRNVEQLKSRHSISSEEYVTDSDEDTYTADESGETVIVPVEDAVEGKFINRFTG